MTRHPFGWDLPPGVTQHMIDEAYGGDEGPCECCGHDPADCICPECPTCGEQGNPRCYHDLKGSSLTPPGHGLEYNDQQRIGQAKMRIAAHKEQIQDEELFISYLEEGQENVE